MAEYIDREAFLEHMKRTDRYFDVKFDIENFPAADVAPVVFARWEEAEWREYDEQSGETICYPKAGIACTNCRHAFKKDALWSRNFCPNCGANMDDER